MRIRLAHVCAAILAVAGLSHAQAGYWAREAVFYHVYVRSFADSNDDGIGDLRGLTSKLDYIQSLGIDALLLLPIFENAYHIYGGYATVDYHRVDPAYGGDAAFNDLIEKARARNMKVLLDLSLTHVSDTHPWFLAAKKSATAPERRHFLWAGPPCPSGKGVFGAPAWNSIGEGSCYFALYAANVPALNFRDKATADAQIEVGKYWLERGVDGFRLDSAPHIAPVDPAKPEIVKPSPDVTHQFWRRFMSAVKIANPAAIGIGEIFTGNPAELLPWYTTGMDMTFDFPVFFGIVDAFSSGRKQKLAAAVSQSLATRAGVGMRGLFLGNHDVPGEFIAPHGRIADLLQGDIRRMQSATLLLFTLPGTPFVYYGDEIGMRGAAPPGPSGAAPDKTRKIWSRNPMKWDETPAHGFSSAKPWAPFSSERANAADQDGNFDTMLETYRGLAKIRRNTPALLRGSYREIPSDTDRVFSFLRTESTQNIVVAVNLTNSEVTVHLALKEAGLKSGSTHDHIFGSSLPGLTPANAARYPLNLPPGSCRCLSISAQ